MNIAMMIRPVRPGCAARFIKQCVHQDRDRHCTCEEPCKYKQCSEAPRK